MTVEIILNGQYKLDVNDDINVLLTYQVGDVRNFLGRNSSFSKTISIAGTVNNNQAFKCLFDITNDSDYNPNKKADVIVINGGVTIFKGYLKIDGIKIDNSKKISYECTIYSEVADMFTNLGQLQLKDLDFSEYNHVYSMHTVTGSWETFIVKNNVEIPFNNGNGYVYPYIDYAKGEKVGRQRSVEFFKPALFAKTIWDKIFLESDYSYKSDFINSDYFRSLIVTPDAKSFYLDDKTVENAKLLASQNDNNHGVYTTFNTFAFTSSTFNVAFQDDSTGGNYDNGNNYNNSTYTYTVPVTGMYKMEADFNMDTQIFDGTLSMGASTEFVVQAVVGYYASITYTRNGVEHLIDSQSTVKIYNTRIFTNGDKLGALNNDVPNFDMVPTAYLQAGDVVKVRIKHLFNISQMFRPNSSQVTHPQMNLCQMADSFLNIELLNNDIYEGLPLNFNTLLTNDLCKDYILSIAKMFNLYFEFDPNNPKCLIIEPRKDFYIGNVLDWTYKLDRSNMLEVFPMSEINAKNYLFTYKSDSDHYNKDYTDKTTEVYGQYTYEIDNDFVSRTTQEQIDLIFAPTPLINELEAKSDKIISAIYDIDTTNNTVTNQALTSSQLRILFYKGMIPCKNWSIYDNTKVCFLTSYPYAGYLDNPFNPTEDLCFTFPKIYYYNRSSLTNSNLFNRWWKSSIEDITDKSSKLVTGYFKLNTADIATLSFRNIIYLDSAYWIINKISDFNPIEENLTKVELLKLINYTTTSQDVDVKQQTINLNVGQTRIQTGDGASKEIGIIVKNGQLPFEHSNLITGQNNIGALNTSGMVVGGNRNIIGSLAASSAVLGNGNFIGGGTNSTVVVGNNNNFAEQYLNNALVVGENISGSTINNAVNTNNVNLITNNGTAESGQITVNGDSAMEIASTGITVNGSILQNINKIDAGKNTITEEFPLYTTISFISAGRDAVRGFGSNTTVNFISGGRNSVLKT